MTSLCFYFIRKPSAFISCSGYRFKEFGTDGGQAAKALRPKFNVLSRHVETHTGFEIPHVEVSLWLSLFGIFSRYTQLNMICDSQMKHLVLGAIVLKGLGSLLFIFGSTLGAYFLVCIILCVIFLLVGLPLNNGFCGVTFFGNQYCLNLLV